MVGQVYVKYRPGPKREWLLVPGYVGRGIIEETERGSRERSFWVDWGVHSRRQEQLEQGQQWVQEVGSGCGSHDVLGSSCAVT